MDFVEFLCELYFCLISYWYGLVYEVGVLFDFRVRVGCFGCDLVLMGNVELFGGWEDCG